MCEAIQILKQQQMHVFKEKEKLLKQLESKYMYYIHSLLLQKILIATNITKKYDEMLNNINNSIYNYISCSIIGYNGGVQVLDVETLKGEPTLTNINNINTSNQRMESQNNVISNNEYIATHTTPIHHRHAAIAGHLSVLKKRKARATSDHCTKINTNKTKNKNKHNHINLQQSLSNNRAKSLSNISKHLSIDNIDDIDDIDNIDIDVFEETATIINNSYAQQYNGGVQVLDVETDIIATEPNKVNEIDDSTHLEIAESVQKTDPKNNRSNTDNCNISQKLYLSHVNLKCIDCDQSFKSEKSFQNHMKIKHNNFKPFLCGQCNKTFARKRTLTYHIRSVHDKETRFECDVCHKRFFWKSHWKEHYMTHTGEKPHKCNVCNQAFVRNGDLTVHKRRHTGEKSYKCIICKKSFSKRSIKNKHQKKCIEYKSQNMNTNTNKKASKPRDRDNRINNKSSKTLRGRTPNWLDHQERKWFKAMEMLTKFDHRKHYRQKFLQVFEAAVHNKFQHFWQNQVPTPQELKTLESIFEKLYFEHFNSIRVVREYQQNMQTKSKK